MYLCMQSVGFKPFLFPHSKTVIVCDGVVTCPGGFSVFPLNPYLDTFQVPSVLNTNKPWMNILCIFKFHKGLYVQKGQI